MSKRCKPRLAMVFCGVDVSAATLAVAVQQEDQAIEQREFANSASGHRALIGWLRQHKASARVSLVYGIFRSLTPYDGHKLFPALTQEKRNIPSQHP